MNSERIYRFAPRAARAALILGVAAMFSGASFAGECPAGKVASNAVTSGATEPAGVTDKVIGSIDLGMKAVALKDEQFRLRQLVVQPGGVVPWHSHGERPAIIYVVKGAITEYRSNCSVPIEHKAGEVTTEFGADLAHWWKNNTRHPAVLLSSDILHSDSSDKSMM